MTIVTDSLNPAQQAVIDRGLLGSGFNLVLQMPTGSGKTWLAERAIATTLAAGRRAVYLTPLRALASELLARWSVTFPDHAVGAFTGEHGPRHAFPVPFDTARLLIMTPERLDACTRHWRSHWNWLPEVDLVVVDELHLLGEHGRGARLEGALLRTRRLNPFLRMLGLSATLGNRSELATWLGGVDFSHDWRPVPITWRQVRYRRATDKPSLLAATVGACVATGGKSLVFVQSRRRAETLALTLREAGIPTGHHHAGLDAEERSKQEAAFRTGELRALVSTGTLEMGLNLPARQVVLYDLQAFDGTDFTPLSVNTVWQRAGRAGRRGLDESGEVVLMAASWDRDVNRYGLGRFERIASRLDDGAALAEQVLAEISSGLARTRTQLARSLTNSLAAHQNRLPALDGVIDDMLGAAMIAEVPADEGRGAMLKATRLGRIAVRQMLSPASVMLLARNLREGSEPQPTILDILLVCAACPDCEPRLQADFEDLDEIGAILETERSTFLSATTEFVRARLGIDGRRLLSAIVCALVMRDWTRSGNDVAVAQRFGCYAFEVRRLAESMERLLVAATAIATPPRPAPDEAQAGSNDRAPGSRNGASADTVSIAQRLHAMIAMIVHGLDEETVTLTFVPGIGGKLARRLKDAGITDIEALSLAELEDLETMRGVSAARARRWIDTATSLVDTHSAFALRDDAARAEVARSEGLDGIDPYRLRRALELKLRPVGDAFEVTGGLEPHRVTRDARGHPRCDCMDFAKGHACKHVLALRLAGGDPKLADLAARLGEEKASGSLNLFKLWFRGDRR
jgi:helicase